MDKLIRGLRHFRENLLWERKELFERSAAGQRPLALLVTCSDSRVLPDTLMQADPGDLFVSRNAGNLVPPADTPGGEGATVEYAVTVLGVTDLIVCGHYRCGAVKALLEPEAARDLPKMSEWLAHAGDVRGAVTRDHPDAAGDELWDRAVERNVLGQVENLSRHPAVAARLAAGTVRLHAWVLRFESSEVLAYDPCAGGFSPLLEMAAVHPAMPAAGAGHADRDAPSPPAPTPAAEGGGLASVVRHDVPASFVVALVALPLCLAIAKACGMPPEAGVMTGVVGGLLVSLLSGCRLQVSGPTAGQVVILLGVLERFGPERLGVVVLLAGGIQVLASVLRLGQWFRAVSPAVVLGMLAGIGVVLFAQQFHVLVDDPPAGSPLANLLTIPRAVWWGVTDTHDAHAEHREAAAVGLVTLAVLALWPLAARGRLRLVPASLVAIVLAAALVAALGWPVQRVAFGTLADGLRPPQPVGWADMLADGATWLAAGTIALVASAETLLCAAVIDTMHRGPRTRYDRELAAQGIGNAVCGVLGVLPVTGVIARSSANVQAGARSRWSGVLHGVWLLGLAAVAPSALRQIPAAALAAVLVFTAVKLVDWRGVRALWRENRTEAAIGVATAVGVVTTDLLVGVLLGVALSVLNLLHTFSRLRVRLRSDAVGSHTLLLDGVATFVRLPRLAAALEAVPPGATLRVDLSALSYIDHACLTLLTNWEKQHAAAGGSLVLDWETLHARFRAARPRPRKVR